MPVQPAGNHERNGAPPRQRDARRFFARRPRCGQRTRLRE